MQLSPLVTRRTARASGPRGGVIRAMVATAVLLVCVGCASNATESLPEIVITTHDYHFSAPESVEGGLVQLVVDNEGNVPHQVELLRLFDDVDLDDYVELINSYSRDATDAERADASTAINHELGTYHGGPNEVPAGEQRRVVTELPPGRYAILCYVNTSGEMHVLKGMIGSIEIVPPESSESRRPPGAAAEVTLDDFSIDVRGDLVGGTQLVKVTNTGEQPHELPIFTGISMDSGAGGSSAISPGASTWVELVLEEGTYEFLCYVPDDESGLEHARLGMRKLVEVQAP